VTESELSKRVDLAIHLAERAERLLRLVEDDNLPPEELWLKDRVRGLRDDSDRLRIDLLADLRRMQGTARLVERLEGERS
jgi:hypothetical protein